jgi:hypothetical protein
MYKNVSLLRINNRRERVQWNLTSMTLFQTKFIIVQSIRYGFISMYSTFTYHENKSLNRLEIESVVLNIVSIFYYFFHTFSFFIDYISSSIYRKQVKQLLNIGITISSSRILPSTVTRIN